MSPVGHRYRDEVECGAEQDRNRFETETVTEDMTGKWSSTGIGTFNEKRTTSKNKRTKMAET